MTPLTLSPALARRLAVSQQRLAGPGPAADAAGILDVMRSLGCLQLDPIGVVARSHLLVLFSRLGPYPLAALDQLLWRDRSLFEYWAHCASIVLSEDYPIFRLMMRRIRWSGRTRRWLAQNERLGRSILAQLRRHGPLPARALREEGLRPADWVSTGWTSGRNVSKMLDLLWIRGQIMVAGRDGIQKLWDLTGRVLPDWARRAAAPAREVDRRAVLQSLRALGVGTARHIKAHFTRDFYPNLARTLAELEREGQVQRAEVRDDGRAWPGTWYVAADALPALERLSDGDWSPRTALLSPFDNLICDRPRTELLFDFNFRMEIYVPKSQRKYGYYVLPVLCGDRLVGRIDPEMDRRRGVLTVNAVYAEPGAPAAGRQVAGAIESLASFRGATEIRYNRRRVPAIWKRELLA